MSALEQAGVEYGVQLRGRVWKFGFFVGPYTTRSEAEWMLGQHPAECRPEIVQREVKRWELAPAAEASDAD